MFIFQMQDCMFVYVYINTHMYVYISLEEEFAPHSSTLAWRIPWTEEPGRLQSIGSQTVAQD